jgi:UDP-glucose 4-epimerase
MKIAITGGAGFIGCNLARRLVMGGHTVLIIDDFSTGLVSNLPSASVPIIRTSVTDLGALAESAIGSDVIVHLAARGSVPRSIAEPLATHSVNATGTLNVMEVARRVGAQVIFSSSSSVYGANTELPKTESMWTSPLSPYAASKLAGESYCTAYSESYGVRTTVFRFFNIFGPWQRHDHDYAAVIPRWIWAALNHQPILLDGDGTQTRDFTYVDTVVDTIVDAIDRELNHPQPINLAFGNRFSLLEVIDELERIIGRTLEVEHRPRRAADVPHSQNDPTLLNAVFPSISPVSFSEALEKTVEWMRSNGPEVGSL